MMYYFVDILEYIRQNLRVSCQNRFPETHSVLANLLDFLNEIRVGLWEFWSDILFHWSKKKGSLERLSFYASIKKYITSISVPDHSFFSNSKLKMTSEIYEVNSWAEIFGCGRGRAVKGSLNWVSSLRLLRGFESLF